MVRCALHQLKKRGQIESLGSWPGHCGGKEVVPLKEIIKRVTLDVQVLETLTDGINDL
jgi:hypothetical protein